MQSKILSNQLEAGKGGKISLQTTFACQCGKKYDNFPALYLHFKRKHEQKISTKTNEEDIIIAETKQMKIITYLIKENCQIQKKFKQMMLSFQRIFQKQLDCHSLPVFIEIKNIFEDYMENMLKKAKTKNIEVYIKEIPVHFNDFVLSSMGRKINSTVYPYVCHFLFELWSWMSRQEITDLEMQYIGLGHQF